jgi:hypothetical protein
MDGFKASERKGITASPGDRVGVPTFALEVGGLNETVTVSADAPLIQSQTGERSFTITTQAVQNLPISNRNYGGLASLTPGVLRYRVTIFIKDVSATLAGYIRAQLIAGVIVGVIQGVGLWLLGVPYALVLAVVAGVLEFVPVIGPLVLGIIAALVASFDSWHAALLVVGFLALFRLIHDYVIYPRLISQGVEIHPVVVILAVLSGAELGGVTGVFLSVPLAALLLVCWRHWRDLRLDRSSQLVRPAAEPLLESILIKE